MEKEMMNPRSVLGLSKKSKTLIELGGICLMLFIAFSGAVLGMLQSPLLKAMNSFEYFSTLTIFSTLGLSIMTPVGGKLGDLFGRKKVIIVAGTIASMILPAILGVYVAKKANCQLRFMVITMILLTAAFLPLSFTTPRTSPILYMAMFGIAGIADSFRSVVVTPTAQAMLAPEDLGVGTGLINCVNTSANLFSGAIFGIILDMNQSNVNLGVNLIWGTTAAVGAAGLIFVLLVVRKYLRNQEAMA